MVNRFLFLSSIVFLLALCGCEETLIHNLSERDTNRLITKLQEAGISSQKEKQPDGQWSVLVDRGDMSRALREVELSRLSPKLSSERKAPSVGASKEEQRFSLERGVSAEVEETLQRIPGVLEARVHLTLPTIDPVFGTKLPQTSSSGSVLLIITPETVIDSEGIARLISGASGILEKDISVMKTVSEKSKEILTNPPVMGESSPLSSSFRWQELLSVLALVTVGVGLLTFGYLRKRPDATPRYS